MRLKSIWGRLDKELRPIALFLATSPFFQLVAICAAVIGFIVVIVTAYQISIDLTDRAAEREERQEDAIERAWSRLLRPAAGNTGKGGAISYLLSKEQSLRGVDLSCRAIGNWDAISERCSKPVYFVDITASSPTRLSGLPADLMIYVMSGFFSDVDFSDGQFAGLRIDSVAFEDVNLARATLFGTTTWKAFISGNMGGALLQTAG